MHCILLKLTARLSMPFSRYTCGVQQHCVSWGSLNPREMGDLGSMPSENMQLEIVDAACPRKILSDSTFS